MKKQVVDVDIIKSSIGIYDTLRKNLESEIMNNHLNDSETVVKNTIIYAYRRIIDELNSLLEDSEEIDTLY